MSTLVNMVEAATHSPTVKRWLLCRVTVYNKIWVDKCFMIFVKVFVSVPFVVADYASFSIYLPQLRAFYLVRLPFKMMFSIADKHLRVITVLRAEKHYVAKRLIIEFPNRRWSQGTLNHFLSKLDAILCGHCSILSVVAPEDVWGYSMTLIFLM